MSSPARRSQSGQAVVIVGASMGAIAALRYAAGPVVDPGLVGVVAVSSPAGWRLPRNARSVLAAGLTRTRLGRLLPERCALPESGR